MDDYFAGSRTPAPGPAPLPPPTPGPAPYAAPAPAAWPPAPTQGFPNAYPPAYPPVQGWVPPAAGPSNAGRNVVLVVVGAVGALVIFGILAAIAIPVFLNQRSKAEAAHTTVTVPTQVQGLPQLTDRVSAAQVERLRTMPGAGLQFAGAYGNGQVTVVVGAAKSALGFDDRRAYFAGASRSATQQGITLRRIDAGKLGGEMRCGASATLPMTICAFADGGSYGVVVVTGPARDAEGTARAGREAFVHRT